MNRSRPFLRLLQGRHSHTGFQAPEGYRVILCVALKGFSNSVLHWFSNLLRDLKPVTVLPGITKAILSFLYPDP